MPALIGSVTSRRGSSGRRWISRQPPPAGDDAVFGATAKRILSPRAARALERQLIIVPVMLVTCEAPLSIATLQWLDMRDFAAPGLSDERFQRGRAADTGT